MALFPQEVFHDAAKPEVATTLSDYELAMNSIVERHGEISDAEVERLALRLDEYCAGLVIDEMFSDQPTYAQFMEREEEFDAACRQKIAEYGEGKFDLPKPESKKHGPENTPTEP